MLGRKKQRGLTLVELLVALVAGLTVTSGVLYIYVSTLNAHTDTVRATRLEEELSATMNLMVKDMQRAGYARIALDRAAQGLPFPDPDQSETQNPFAVFAIGDVVDGGDPDDPLTDCILYAYDESDSGSTGVDDGDRRGFRLRETDGDGVRVVDMLQSSTVAIDPSDPDCSVGSWQPLTSAFAGNITDLAFSDIGPATISASSADVDVRVIQIELTGSSGTGDNFVGRTLTETVRVRNDQVCDSGGC